MKLNKLYKMQEELDQHILENNFKRTGKKMDRAELLNSTILALLVEIGELANATRCFKHWSTKGSMSNEIILDELADVWHFYLSIGNQIKYKLPSKFLISESKYKFIVGNDTRMEDIIIKLLAEVVNIKIMEDVSKYEGAGMSIYILGKFLGFTDEEVEQAYLKKHEENYKRQREGY